MSRVVLLTGAASGIGKHLLHQLVVRGDRVLATDVNEVGLRAAADEVAGLGEVLLERLDVRDDGRWRELVALAAARWGRLDALLNVAGYLLPGYCHQSDAAQVDLHLDINAKGVILGTQAAAALMVAQGGGHIVNIASLAGVAPVPGLTLYSASKFAVRGYSLAAAQELRPLGVHVTVVCPDAVRTPMLDLQVAYKEAALTFSGDPLTVEDVGRAVLAALDRPGALEVLLPTSRGLLAKLASLLPGLAQRLLPGLRDQGLRRQAAHAGAAPTGTGRPRGR